MAPRRRTVAVVVCACAAAAAAAACGKKGPPLAPLIHVPGAVDGMTARRVGDTVYLALPVPAANIDGSMPADVSRIEVYGATSTAALPRARFLEIATLVDTVTLPDRDPRVRATTAPSGSAAARDTAAPDAAPMRLHVTDQLTTESVTPRALPPLTGRLAPAARSPFPPLQVAEASQLPQRFYLAIPFNDRGQSGPPSTPVAIPMAPLPEAPADVRLSYSATGVLVEWEPSGGVVGFLLEGALPIETLDDSPDVAGVSGRAARTGYNVYRELAADPLALPGPPGSLSDTDGAPVPVNPAPQPTLSFADDVQFDRQRCYQIRAVREVGPDRVEGHASVRRCLTPLDIFPPAQPTGLSAVAASGTISLIWEPSPDFDTVGYVVLRGSGPDATLQPITSVPLTDTTYTDRDVTPGVRYVYAVVAVDARLPVANMSPESSRIEETAR